jgi:hypothetical protein
MSLDQESSSAPESESVENPLNWPKHLALFALTLLSVFHVGAQNALSRDVDFGAWFAGFFDPKFLVHGAAFALPLMGILLTHEFGHYFAARWHKVPASLPYFIPLPGIGWGTFGAVIAMRGAIRSRKALFDIGASGPIAGLVVALPVLIWGLLHSPVETLPESGYQQEGQSLLYLVLKRALLGPIPDGSDVILHPAALAGWVGLMITMINLFPWGQLDGGHIAFALFGEPQHRFARWFRRSLLLLFLGNLAYFVVPVLLHRSGLGLPTAVSNSIFWLMWFGVLGLIARISGGADHPPFEAGELGLVRRCLAWACLALFALLFMPTPFAGY